jgi:Leucine-rich repeat (LRR) protein
MEKLVNLRVLNLAHNSIEAFPEFILSFKNLEYLNLSNNTIPSIPDEITTLVYLKTLDLFFNKIKILSSTIVDFLLPLSTSGSREIVFDELDELIAEHAKREVAMNVCTGILLSRNPYDKEYFGSDLCFKRKFIKSVKILQDMKRFYNDRQRVYAFLGSNNVFPADIARQISCDIMGVRLGSLYRPQPPQPLQPPQRLPLSGCQGGAACADRCRCVQN